jgi:hypothetical protein
LIFDAPRWFFRRGAVLLVNFFSIADSNDFNDESGIEDIVDYAVLPDAYSVSTLGSGEFPDTIGAWFSG